MKKTKQLPAKTIDVLKDVPSPQKYPWPYKSESVSELTCNNVLEFIPGKDRGRFMDEIHRVLVKGGRAVFTTRFWNSASSVQDYLYEWPPLVEESFLYYNKGWRDANGLQSRGLKSDFDFTYGHVVTPDTANRNDETRQFHVKHYSNTVQALQLFLIKR